MLVDNKTATVNSDMLRELIQTETNNHECLRKLESRIKMLESSNQEVGSRKENIILNQGQEITGFRG